MENVDKVVPNETEIKEGVRVSSKILLELAEETTVKSKENSGEAFSFILDKEGSQIILKVGVGHSWGVAYSSEEAISKLKPFINEGFKVVADYHNHTPESVRVYQKVGMSPEYAFSPSFADIHSEIPANVRQELNQEDFPHLIGVYVDTTDNVFINGFRYLRDATVGEEKEIEFDDPFYTETEKDESGIQLLASKYTDPRKSFEKGIIKSTLVLSDLDNDSNIKINTTIHQLNMLEGVELTNKQDRRIITSISELPPVEYDHVRGVHLTDEHHIDSILDTGINYSRHGMAASTARAWQTNDEVEFSTTDPRFNHKGIRAVVFDLSNDEWKLHNKIGKAPGKIGPEKIIAVIDPKQK